MSKGLISVGDIQIQLDGHSIIFAPTDDITGKEVAMVLQMFLNGMAHKGTEVIDFGSFINKHNLQKHFAEIKDEPQESKENS